MDIPSGRPDASQLSAEGFRCYRRLPLTVVLEDGYGKIMKNRPILSNVALVVIFLVNVKYSVYIYIYIIISNGDKYGHLEGWRMVEGHSITNFLNLGREQKSGDQLVLFQHQLNCQVPYAHQGIKSYWWTSSQAPFGSFGQSGTKFRPMPVPKMTDL